MSLRLYNVLSRYCSEYLARLLRPDNSICLQSNLAMEFRPYMLHVSAELFGRVAGNITFYQLMQCNLVMSLRP